MKTFQALSMFLFSFILSLTACAQEKIVPNSSFAKGADISWVTQMESEGKKFYTVSGNELECTKLMKSLGMNAIRLRVWVTPKDGWNDQNDLLVKAIRAKNLGMRLMVDFHYSDTWADPGKQTKPAAWTSLNFTELKKALANHTIEVLNMLKTNGISPEWVQVGNETANGMLWEDGRTSSNMKNYTELSNTGYDAIKSVFPETKVIIQLHNGFDNNLFRWLFDGMKKYGGKWDVIGMSLYPSVSDWQVLSQQCLNNMNDMVARYGSEVMLCEVGMRWDSPDICKNFLTDILAKTKSVNNQKGLGVFYWEPESSGNWHGYTLGAFDNSGKPTAAMEAFK